MDWMEFVASMTSSLAWPATVGLVAYLFRERLSSAITDLLENRELKHFKVGPVEATLEHVEQRLDAEGAPPADDPASKDVTLLPPPADFKAAPGRMAEAKPVTEESLHALAEQSPESAVMVAAKGVDYELRNLARRSGLALPPGPRSEGVVLAKRLATHGALPEDIVPVVADLRILRSQAVHAPEPIPIEDAKAYVTQTRRLISLLRELDT